MLMGDGRCLPRCEIEARLRRLASQHDEIGNFFRPRQPGRRRFSEDAGGLGFGLLAFLRAAAAAFMRRLPPQLLHTRSPSPPGRHMPMPAENDFQRGDASSGRPSACGFRPRRHCRRIVDDAFALMIAPPA